MKELFIAGGLVSLLVVGILGLVYLFWVFMAYLLLWAFTQMGFATVGSAWLWGLVLFVLSNIFSRTVTITAKHD